MIVSFHAKSLWVRLISLLVGFSYYCAKVFPSHSPSVLPHQVVLFVGVIVLLVVMQVAGQGVLAVFDRRTMPDERDRLIELKAARVASYVLATGVFFALGAGLLTSGNFVFTHILLGFWLLAQVVEIAAQLFHHQWGG
jgi:hypothetical protein